MGSSATFVSQLMNSTWYGVFARLSRLVGRLERTHELDLCAGQGELKYSTARFIRLRPQPAPVSFDNGLADRQPHPHSAGLCGIERLENTLEVLRIDTRSSIDYRDEGATNLALPGADRQLARPLLDRAHCFDRIQDQVQDDLLQLNTVPLNGRRPPRHSSLYQDSILVDRAARQHNHLIDCLIEIKTLLLRGSFLDVVAEPVDDDCSPIGIADNAIERFASLGQVWRVRFEKIQSRTGVVARGPNGLLDFMSDRCRDRAQRHQLPHARKLLPRRPQLFFGCLDPGDVARNGINSIAVRDGRPGKPAKRATLVPHPIFKL